MNERQHIEAAIAGYRKRINLLKDQGIAHGSVVTGANGKGKPQSHFVPAMGGKRTYLKKAEVRERRAACQRWKRVRELERKVELLQAVLRNSFVGSSCRR